MPLPSLSSDRSDLVSRCVSLFGSKETVVSYFRRFSLVFRLLDDNFPSIRL